MGFEDGGLQMGPSLELLSMLFGAGAKSIIILATALLLARKLRFASARLRHMLWCAALSSLLVLPVFTGGFQPVSVPILPSGLFPNEVAATQGSQSATDEKLSAQTATTFPPNSGPESKQNNRSNPAFAGEQWLSWQSIILLVWLTGALLVLGRFLIGVVTARRLVGRATPLTDNSWSKLRFELSQQIRLKRTVRLLRSNESIMPMACGGWSAAVVLPREADHWSADRRRVVVLHELIHIRRRDLLTQGLAQVVCALYWFNPLAWWARRKLLREQEWACDEDVVATGIGRSDYAAHLLSIARKFSVDRLSAVSSTAMARPSQLERRLRAIVCPAYHRYGSRRMIAVSIVVMSAVFISTAVTQLVTAKRRSVPAAATVTRGAIQTGEMVDEMHLSEQKFVVTEERAAAASVGGPAPQYTRTPPPTPIDKPAAPPTDSPADPLPVSHDTVDRTTAEQIFNGFSEEEVTRLMSNGIGPAYIREMRAAGYPQLDVAQLIALFSNGVNGAYIAGLRSVGYSELSTSDLLSLKTNGVSPNLIRSFQAVKHADFEAKKYASMLSNGVTPSYLRSLNAVGYENLTANQAIAMRLAGVTAEFIDDAKARGHSNLSPNDLIKLKRRESP